MFSVEFLLVWLAFLYLKVTGRKSLTDGEKKTRDKSAFNLTTFISLNVNNNHNTNTLLEQVTQTGQ